ncbi:MAG: sulfite exporter TauE/SafE family protein [endosymbiont of Seepiophila jonesi]|uniref:Sulfite exporter TauE/SafE family protein n=1 Tax=endosymbiont of Lamellibrachia luymesi TaxID=2200907 RepID=A0A370DZY1_9GAMM|nr:MAG: sulfite exporter TauE/SafE family protein [endosymbiont of Seepiophila jonesi]RDH92365.1 MAG: sulfite exporter TauE/SafE family protein [endosymbiont of Lamellibrachia luymesi]
MNGEFTLALAFATGIFGAFHCVGMCGGINGGFFIRYGNFPNLLPVLAFHGARIGVYTLLGVSGALLGQVVVQAGIVGKAQGVLMILAGVLIVILGLNLLDLIGKKRKQQSRKVWFSEDDFINQRQSLPLVAGLFNGFVPCSLVFSVAIKAASSADPLNAGLLMLAFGAGALPAMATVSLLGSFVGLKARGSLAKLAGVSVILLGLWTVYEGVTFYNIMRGLANW